MTPAQEKKLRKEMATGIGASECHHLFSLEPYGCARQLWYNKSGVSPDHPFIGNKDTDRGHALEDVVRKIYVKMTGNKVAKSGLLRHPTLQSLICHPDGIISQIAGDGRSFDGRGLLEIKCPGMWNFKKVKAEGLPYAWILQAQHGMLVGGFAWSHVVVHSAELWETLPPVTVLGDGDIQSKIYYQAKDAWEALALREEVLGFRFGRLRPDDKRCQTCPWRTKCQGAALVSRVAEYQKLDELEVLPRDDSLAPLVQEYCEARELEKEAKRLKAGVAAQLQLAIGDRPGVMNDSGKVHYKPSSKVTVDTKALRREMPEVAKKYERTSVVRSLKVYGVQGEGDDE